jgi:hypothetical protein
VPSGPRVGTDKRGADTEGSGVIGAEDALAIGADLFA